MKWHGQATEKLYLLLGGWDMRSKNVVVQFRTISRARLPGDATKVNSKCHPWLTPGESLALNSFPGFTSFWDNVRYIMGAPYLCDV